MLQFMVTWVRTDYVDASSIEGGFYVPERIIADGAGVRLCVAGTPILNPVAPGDITAIEPTFRRCTSEKIWPGLHE